MRAFYSILVGANVKINQLATEYEIAPNLIRNWKKKFLDNASVVFDEKVRTKKNLKMHVNKKMNTQKK